MFRKSGRFAVLLLLVFTALLAACAPVTSQQEYRALKEQLDKTDALLKQSNDELDRTKAALTKTSEDLSKIQTAGLEVILSKRRSVREYANSPLSKNEVMKLLWAGQGITADTGARTAPSAGPFYPLRVYLVVGNVADMVPGIYKYVPVDNQLVQAKEGDVRAGLAAAAYGQECVQNGAIDIIIAAVYENTAAKYGEKAARFVQMEAGHAAQNICLEAAALNLGLVTVGGFDDASVAKILGLQRNENPLYIIPVGKKK